MYNGLIAFVAPELLPMNSPTLSFAQEPARPAASVATPARMMWKFHSRSGLDAPFHDLVSRFGDEIIMELDEIVLDTPIKAAIRATKVFQRYSAQIGRQDEVRHVMTHLAQGIKTVSDLDELALVPPDAVFRGFSRPRN